MHAFINITVTTLCMCPSVDSGRPAWGRRHGGMHKHFTCRTHVQICLWRYQQVSEQSTARGAAGVAAGNAVEEITSEAKSACNSLALSWLPLGQHVSSNLHIVSAYENGSVLHQIADR